MQAKLTQTIWRCCGIKAEKAKGLKSEGFLLTEFLLWNVLNKPNYVSSNIPTLSKLVQRSI